MPVGRLRAARCVDSSDAGGQVILKFIGYGGEIAFDAPDAAESFAVESDVLLIHLQFISHGGNQLRRADKQQAKRKLKAGDIIDIQEGKT
ncbi:hypothetical protein NS31R_09455 [Enterobacter cancerogenus]|nr:hypothetical protein NS104_16555 [Enterobacter cancerogenus]KTQ50701.1 hypothetical protein NS111_16275 [Enterobacter cancerogenus]KTQ68274.1 hypothetical protein NS188_21720 [Enterobacter cancerogenus]KTQ81888.1 hypothetical protein NS31R_09455 [Enterobacter cancerogenus]